MREPYRERPLTEDEEGDDDVVVVATHNTPVEAAMAREYLLEHGIKASVSEAGNYNPMVSLALGSRVMVRSVDEARARSLLRRVEKTQTTDEDDGEDGEVRCPRCELAYCYFERTSSTSPTIFGVLEYLFAKKRWRCRKCGHAWDDPGEGPKRMTPLHPDDPRPVFRLRRRHAGTGLFFGSFAAFAMLAILSIIDATMLAPLLLVLPVVGYVIGRRTITDMCSAPGCLQPLLPDAKQCPACRGAIAGTIHRANEHFAEAAAVRRELAELRAKKTAAPKKKKKKRIAAEKADDEPGASAAG